MINSKAALEIILRARDEASKTIGNAERQFSGLGNTVRGLAGGALKLGAGALIGVGTAAAGAGLAIGKLAMDAAPLQGIRASFEALNEDAGKTLETLRQGALGMVTDAELMQGYNKAVQMVGQSFADDLPEAMKYLSKISASTGQDMGFLLDSLTTGIGRLSPMILDNLNIQVDAAAANEAYAASLGKEASELTKAEQQAALMAQVMEKLRDNTAALPDITGNTSTSMAQLKTQFENAKNAIGEAFLPALNALLQPLAELAQKYGPQVVAFAQQAGAWLGENLPKAIAWLGETWNAVFPVVSAAVEKAWSIIQPIFQGIKTSSDSNLGWVVAWVRENWPLIQQTIVVIMKTIHDVVQAVLEAIRAFWDEHGEAIMGIVENVWAVIQTIWDTGLRNIFDTLKVIMQLITGDTEGAMETLKGIFSRTVDAVMSICKRFYDVGRSIVDGIREGFKSAWDSFKSWLKGKIEGLIGDVMGWLGIGSPSKVFMGIGENLMRGLEVGIESFGNLPQLALQAQVAALPAAAMAGGGGMGGGVVVNNYFGPGSVRSMEDIEAIDQNIREALMLRGVRRVRI